jgi:uncharacterized protein (TIGR02246 family)
VSSEAQRAITRLIVVYSHLLDDQVYDEWVKLFAEDGLIAFGGVEHRGRPAIKDAVAAIQPAKPGKHFTGPPVIEVDDDDTARAWTDMVTFSYAEDGSLKVAGMSRYHDIIRRVDGHWLFAARYMHAPGQQLLPGAPPQPTA